MDQRDMELLDRELWGVGHHPPQNTAITGFSVIAMFFVGLALGGILFASESKPPQIGSNEAMTAILQSESPVVR
jgi:hypothetical protein